MFLSNRGASILTFVLFCSLGSALQALEPTRVFRVVANPSNVSGDSVFIDHEFTNNNPAARLIVTSVFLTGANDHPIGVAYDSLLGKWSIYNEDGAAMINNGTIGFNVRATRQTADARTFLALASATNSRIDQTTIRRRGVTFHPSALLLITHNFNPPRVPGVRLNKNLGVRFLAPNWAWYNEDVSAPLAVAVNVANITGTPDAFFHQSSAANVLAAETIIDHPLANNNPDALVFVTHNYSTDGPVHDKPVGVYYDGSNWAIFNQDISAMPRGIGFNVKIYSGAN